MNPLKPQLLRRQASAPAATRGAAPTFHTRSPTQPDELDHRIANLLHSSQALGAECAPAPLDNATVTRVMNNLRARGCFDDKATPDVARATTRPTLAPSLWSARRGAKGGGALAGQAQPTGWGGWALPTAALAAVVAAVTVGGYSVAPQPGAPGGAYTKSLSAPTAQVVRTPQPAVAASELVSVLAASGVHAEVRREGADRVVQAAIAGSDLPRLAAVLEHEGLATPSDGLLVVRFAAVQP